MRYKIPRPNTSLVPAAMLTTMALCLSTATHAAAYLEFNRTPLNVTLIDLDPNDGIAPNVQFYNGSFRASLNVGGYGPGTWSSYYETREIPAGPLQYLGYPPAWSDSAFSYTFAGGLTGAETLLLYTNDLNGAGLAQKQASAEFVLSANTEMVLSYDYSGFLAISGLHSNSTATALTFNNIFCITSSDVPAGGCGNLSGGTSTDPQTGAYISSPFAGTIGDRIRNPLPYDIRGAYSDFGNIGAFNGLVSAPIPEASQMWLMLLGLALLVNRQRTLASRQSAVLPA